MTLAQLLKVSRSLTIPASEQLTASLGTFTFMLVGARLLSTEGFGAIALLWNLIQFPAAVFFALVLLPISASKENYGERREIIGHAIILYFYISAASAAFLPLCFKLLSGKSFVLSFKLSILLVGWNVLQLSFELVRWSIIRFGNARTALYINICRWIIFLFAVFITWLSEGSISFTSFLVINFICLVGSIGFGVFSLRSILSDIDLRIRISSSQMHAGLPQLANGIANASLNYIFVAMLARSFSLEVLGAYQAYKSLANVFSTLSQFIDNHVTSHIARRGGDIKLGGRFFAGVVLISIGSFLVGYLLKNVVASVSLGNHYQKYASLFAILFFGATIQLLMRPIATQIRINNLNNLFYYGAAIVAVIIIPLVIVFSLIGYLYTIVFLTVLAPVSLFVVYLFYNSKQRHKCQLQIIEIAK